jgi:copper(I)-binding protein
VGRALQKSTAPRRLAVVAALATGLGLAAAGCSAGQITQTDTQVAAVNGAGGQVGDVAVRDAQFLFPVAHGSYEQGDDAPIVVVIANNGTEADKLLGVTSESSAPAEISGDTRLEPASVIVAGADQDDAGSHSTATSSAKASSSASHEPSGSVTATTTTTPSGSVTVSESGSAPVTTTGSATTGSATTGSATTGSATPTSGSGTSISAPPTTGTKLPSSVDPTEPGSVKIVLKGLKKPLRPGETIRVTFLFEKAGELTLELPIGATPEPRKDAPSEH